MGLLTLMQQQTIKPISPNWAVKAKVTGGVDNFTQLEIEVEQNEMSKLLGMALLLDIQNNSTDAKYVDLLDGKTFKNCLDQTVKFYGIRYQIAYMNFSEYIPTSQIADTFTGMVQKNRNETQPISQGAVKQQQARVREIALTDFEVMKVFLNENSDTYPLWNNGKTKKIYTPKFITLKKTIK